MPIAKITEAEFAKFISERRARHAVQDKEYVVRTDSKFSFPDYIQFHMQVKAGLEARSILCLQLSKPDLAHMNTGSIVKSVLALRSRMMRDFPNKLWFYTRFAKEGKIYVSNRNEVRFTQHRLQLATVAA